LVLHPPSSHKENVIDQRLKELQELNMKNMTDLNILKSRNEELQEIIGLKEREIKEM